MQTSESSRKWNYFSDAEVEGLDPEFVAFLDRARHKASIPFVLTSTFRDPVKNAEVGGVSDSAHTKGLAADIRCGSSNTLYKILDGLYSAGVKRIGIYYRIDDANGEFQYTHVHCDIDPTKPQEVVFLKEKE